MKIEKKFCSPQTDSRKEGNSHTPHDKPSMEIEVEDVAAEDVRPRSPPPAAAPNIIACPDEINQRIAKGVLRAKLSKRRHLVVPKAISPAYLDRLMPPVVTSLFEPQSITYNGGVANVKNWRISCYLEVMEGGTPCTNPHEGLRSHFWDLLDTCNALFATWYRQQHACNGGPSGISKDRQTNIKVSRLMTFVTRYTPAPDER